MKTLYEGILKGMDDTLSSGSSDVAAAGRDEIIKGITATKDAKKQEHVIKLFKDILEDYYARRYKNSNHFSKRPESWWILFDDKANKRPFTMVRKIGSLYYIVAIDELGTNARYDRMTNSSSTIDFYLSSNSAIFYEIDDTMPELDKMCDDILRIMYLK